MAIAASLDDLARASSLVVVGTPIEQRSSWVDGRIVTESRVRLDESVADVDGAHRGASEVWVRTLGGVADGIGQLVSGEAKLVVNQPSLLFLKPHATSTKSREMMSVVSRDQGQYDVTSKVGAVRPIRTLVAHKESHLVQRSWAPPLATPAVPAVHALDGKNVDEAKEVIVQAWSRTHAK